ncbi:MAG: ATP-binding protein [Deltaproteobacteria bacterium]|nr:ATP-binding protein [Deltaproteobacteria bacterium]
MLLTGPRRSGKTTLARSEFPGASYHLLEAPDTIARVRSDPRSFISELETPTILDEVQNVPEIFGFIRDRIDRSPSSMGRWILTGSQEAPLMRGVSESMAGRVAVFQLLPFSTLETPKVTLLRGGFPEVVLRPRTASIWFRSYVQTYLERDVRSVTAIRDLATFRRFIALVASRTGQILNKTDLAAPLGVTVPTITEWLEILQITGQILLVPPFYENFGKRLIKSPKLYFVDSGLACHLLHVDTASQLSSSPFRGALWEGFVASEIVKAQLNAGRRTELYYFRDQQGLEVDFLVPNRSGRLALIEAKGSRTPSPQMAEPLARLARAVKSYDTDRWVVYPGSPDPTSGTVLSPGASALTLEAALGRLGLGGSAMRRQPRLAPRRGGRPRG